MIARHPGWAVSGVVKRFSKRWMLSSAERAWISWCSRRMLRAVRVRDVAVLLFDLSLSLGGGAYVGSQVSPRRKVLTSVKRVRKGRPLQLSCHLLSGAGDWQSDSVRIDDGNLTLGATARSVRLEEVSITALGNLGAQVGPKTETGPMTAVRLELAGESHIVATDAVGLATLALVCSWPAPSGIPKYEA